MIFGKFLPNFSQVEKKYQKQLSEEEPKFILLFDKGFKIIETCLMTCMENIIKYCNFFWAFYLLSSFKSDT